MQCPRCQAENRAGRRFCAECGAPLALPCSSCGFSNEPEEKFCGGCGIPLTAAPRPPEQAIDVRLNLQSALAPLGEETRIFDNLHAAESLAERLGDDQRLGRIAGSLGTHFSAIGLIWVREPSWAARIT